MQVIEWSRLINETPLKGSPSAITVGVFDGVHRGHMAIIEQIVSYDKHVVPVVITFIQSHHKKARSGKQDYPGDILSYRQKIAAFESLGVSLTVIVEFSESFRRMRGEEFLRILHERCNMSFMAVGNNFRCGYRLDTDASAIQQFNDRRNIPTCIVQSLTESSEPISSSQIRAAIAGGRVQTAQMMLGCPFTVDLGGASVESTGNGNAYDIAGQGRILPPPGRYPVLLLGKNHNKTTEILVEGGKIITSRDFTGEFPEPEYVKFLSNSVSC